MLPPSRTDAAASSVFLFLRIKNGSTGARTLDLLVVTQTLSQLSYASKNGLYHTPFEIASQTMLRRIAANDAPQNRRKCSAG